MKISVAMATYNGERFLCEQLQSLAQQIVKPYELVVTDDGSTDATLTMLKEFSARAPFPVHIHVNEARLGYGENFLKAASLCTGDWIAFCDQDDVWLPDKLARLTEIIRRQPKLNCIIHEALACDESLRVMGQRWRARINWILRSHVAGALRFSYRVYAGFCICFRADMLTLVSVDDRPTLPNGARLPHDAWVTQLAYIFGGTQFLSAKLALYRRHSRAETANYRHGVAARFARVRGTDSSHYQNEALVRRHVARELAALARKCPPEYRPYFHAGSHQFQRLAEWAERRSGIYRATLVLTRGWALLIAIFRGCYHGSIRPRTSGYGTLALLKDALRVLAG